MSTKSKPLATVVVLTIIFVLPILIRGAANDVTPVHTSVTEETSVVMEGPKEVETTSTIVSDVSEETTEESADIPTEEQEEEPEEKPAEEPEPEEESVGMQMTFDDIFRNPFVNDFEPLEVEPELHDEAEKEIEAEPEQETENVEVPEEAVENIPAEEPAEETEPESVEEAEQSAEEPAPDEQPEQETEEEPEPQKEPEPEQEQEPEPETEIEETIEIDDIFDVPADEPADETNDEPEPDNTDEEEAAKAVQAVEQAEEEARAKSEAEAKARTEENIQKYGVDFVSEESSAEDQNDYSEAKAMRHEDMQNALLMAMVDGSDTSFCETVNKLMEKGDLNARTLRSRMPIDKEELNRVLSDPDHKPDKKTAIAICFALRLTWEDSVRLLYKAGHVLSDSSRYDLTIEYLMRRGVYDQNMINSVLRGSGLDGFGIPKSEI